MKLLFCLFMIMETFDLAAQPSAPNVVSSETIPAEDFVREDCYRGEECYTHRSKDFYRPDAYFGYIHVKNRSAREVRRTSDYLIYDVDYEFDQYSRRTSLHSESDRPHFAAFFGCSFAFGVGLETSETLSSLLSVSDPRFASYNYAIGGTGTNTMLALSEKRDLRSEISQQSGLFIYVFITSHIERATGRLPSLTWLTETPYYLSTNLDYAGSFGSGGVVRSLWTRLLLVLNDWVPFVRGKTFPSDSEADYEHVCAMVAKSKENFLKQFPSSEFLFYVHPFATSQFAAEFKSCLEDKQIAILKSKHNFHADYEIEIDGHPNGVINQLIVDEIGDYVNTRKLLSDSVEVTNE